MKEVNVKWVDSTFMVGSDSKGNTVTLGTRKTEDPQWKGMGPSDLLLIAAASCSGYDVVTILEKQKEPMTDMEVKVTGKQLEEAPYRYTDIHLHYEIAGDVNPDKVKKAIELSQDKYCSVINTFSDKVNVTYDFKIKK